MSTTWSCAMRPCGCFTTEMREELRPVTSAILFDLDDTLVADEAATTDAFLAASLLAQARHGIDPTALTNSVRRQAQRLWRAAPTITYCRAIGISSTEGLRARFSGDDPNLVALRAWAPTYRQTAWSAALGELGVADLALADNLAAALVEERGRRNWVYPDVVPALNALRASYRLALVTNGSPDLQRAKLMESGLADYFDAVIVSGEIGAGKPEARPFALALDALGVTHTQAIMVGDSYDRDIIGGRNVGLRTAWLRRQTTLLEEAREYAGIQISDLYQLSALL